MLSSSVMRPVLSAAALALFATTPNAFAARTVEVLGGPPAAAASPGSWKPAGDVTATSVTAPGHVLGPVVDVQAGSLTVQVGAGAVTFRPASLATASGSALARSKPSSGAKLSGSVLKAPSAWEGVHDVYRLQPDGIKHDLVVPVEAVRALGAGDLRVTWLVDLPPGVELSAADDGSALLRDTAGVALARVPAPAVAEGAHPRWRGGIARLSVARSAGATRLELVVPEAWVRDPARQSPLWLDPSVETVFPADVPLTGFVDEFGFRLSSLIDSGSLVAAVGIDGRDARGFAEFDISAIPDAATVLDVRLRVFISNHTNSGREPLECPDVPFGDPCEAQDLDFEIHGVDSQVDVPEDVLHDAIGDGPVYVFDTIGHTGEEFCPETFVERQYDLGPQADSDMQARLADDFFTIGFTSSIANDLDFDHIDYMGFEEETGGFTCFGPVEDSRIRLFVTYNLAPTCDAGGPYERPCAEAALPLDGSGSGDPDGDALSYLWSTDCPGARVTGAQQAMATLELGDACSADCTVTLEVCDGLECSTCTEPVAVGDESPPEILENRLAGGACLWPPRHDFVCLPPADEVIVARDDCGDVRIAYLGCTSDQPDEAPEPGRPENGDGHFSDDCQVDEEGRLCVRVERAGTDPEGRHYTGLIEVRDECDRVTVVETGPLFVPHDRRGGSGGPEDPCLRGGRSKSP